MKQIFLFSFFILSFNLGICSTCSSQGIIAEQKINSPTESLGRFGESVAISGSFAIVGASGDSSNEETPGAAFIFFFNGEKWQQIQKLTASGSGHLSKFGHSVDISGDYAIVGAYGDNSHGATSGTAYIFKRNGFTWSEEQKITANDASGWNKFGNSVAISGHTAIVGAYGDNDKGESAGTVYIFDYVDGIWGQTQKLFANDGSAWDKFGQAVSISGDYAIVGAYGDSDNGSLSGSAYIFSFTGSNWIQTQKLTAQDGSAWDNFGQAVAISGNSAIVGAYKDDDNGLSSGSAYVFYNNGNTWVLEQKITSGDGLRYDFFGYSVSISGDYAAVGAFGDDDFGISSGSAYLFYFNGNSWVQLHKLSSTDASSFDYFGQSVNVDGDFTLVGAFADEIKNKESGSISAIQIDMAAQAN